MSEQRAQVEAADGRLLKRVGLDAAEHDKWLGGWCGVGDTPESNCVWGIAFPGVWQWSLTIGWRSPVGYRQGDLTGCFGDYPVLAVLRRAGQTVAGSGSRAGKASTSGGHTSRSEAVLGRWLTR